MCSYCHFLLIFLKGLMYWCWSSLEAAICLPLELSHALAESFVCCSCHLVIHRLNTISLSLKMYLKENRVCADDILYTRICFQLQCLISVHICFLGKINLAICNQVQLFNLPDNCLSSFRDKLKPYWHVTHCAILRDLPAWISAGMIIIVVWGKKLGNQHM